LHLPPHVVSGTIALVAGRDDALRVLDLVDPSSPRVLSILELGGPLSGIARSGGTAFLHDSRAGVHAVDISRPDDPRLLWSYATPDARPDCCGGESLAVADGWLFVAGGELGLVVLELGRTVADVPREASRLPLDGGTEGGAEATTVAQTLTLVAGQGDGLFIVDAADPANPQLLATVPAVPGPGDPGDGYVGDAAVEDDLAVVAAGTEGLYALDLSDPTHPRKLGGVPTSGFSEGVALQGGVALLADSTSVQIIDASDPSSPVVLGSVPTAGYSESVEFVGAGDVAISTGGDVLETVDLRCFLESRPGS
jgi:hypothetical protein